MPKSKPFNNPFSQVKLANPPESIAAKSPPKPPPPEPREPDDEAALFLQAMGEVVPVKKRGVVAATPPVPNEEDAESLTRLAELVAPNLDFEMSDIEGETLEGRVRTFDERVMRKLRSGAFEPARDIDLHGMTQPEAQRALEQFIQRAKLDGLRCVRVVTGRGLHSVDQLPVLKKMTRAALTTGHASKHVLAFCTAKPADGGYGALYVLLRR